MLAQNSVQFLPYSYVYQVRIHHDGPFVKQPRLNDSIVSLKLLSERGSAGKSSFVYPRIRNGE